MTLDQLQHCCGLEITVWDYERFTTSNFLGALHLNIGKCYTPYDTVRNDTEMHRLYDIKLMGSQLTARNYNSKIGKKELMTIDVSSQNRVHGRVHVFTARTRPV